MRKYTIDGEEVEVIQKLNNGKWLVCFVYQVERNYLDKYVMEDVVGNKLRMVDVIYDEPLMRKVVSS